MREAYDEAGEQEAEHLFLTKGWARELWIDLLGLGAALPPPEKEKSVVTEIGAGRAEHQREEYTRRRRRQRPASCRHRQQPEPERGGHRERGHRGGNHLQRMGTPVVAHVKADPLHLG